MTTTTCPRLRRQHGASLLEVLITMVVLAFGLLGLAAFQAKAHVGSIESYQRAQASVLLQDMQSRLSGNPDNADDYRTENALGAITPLGTNDTLDPDDCLIATGSERDLCEWSAALKGAAEQTGAGANAGAMEGARGCITRVQEADLSPGVCSPAIYLVTVAWQGLHATRAPAQACGRNAYGADTNRRAISARVAIGLPGCR